MCIFLEKGVLEEFLSHAQHVPYSSSKKTRQLGIEGALPPQPPPQLGHAACPRVVCPRKERGAIAATANPTIVIYNIES